MRPTVESTAEEETKEEQETEISGQSSKRKKKNTRTLNKRKDQTFSFSWVKEKFGHNVLQKPKAK